MAGKVFFSVSMSLDGYIAPESVPVEDLFAPEKQDDPDVQRWMAQWMDLQQWICLLYTSPSPRDLSTSRMPSSA